MPLTIDRRGFLISAMAAARLLRASDTSLHAALLSDTHISEDPSDMFRGFSPHANMRKVADMVTKAQPELLVINGDLARANGHKADYEAVNTFVNPLADQMPLVITLGNHDDRDNARKAFAKLTGERQPVVQKLVSLVDGGPCTFVFLDSLLVTGIAPGLLGKAQRDWLIGYLREPSAKPQIIFVHHNPDSETDALLDADKLLADLRPAKNVKALLFGHTHVFSLTKVDGLHLINLPAVGYNFADGNPVGWVDSTFTKTGVSLTLHAIGGETKDDGKTTQLEWRA